MISPSLLNIPMKVWRGQTKPVDQHSSHLTLHRQRGKRMKYVLLVLSFTRNCGKSLNMSEPAVSVLFHVQNYKYCMWPAPARVQYAC